MSPQRLRWHQRRMLCFDTETTAANPEEARIVQACIARVGGGEQTEAKTWLVNPGVEIPEEATKIHGITNERVRAEGIEPVVAVAQMIDLLVAAADDGDPIVIMNAPYDLTVLAREAARCGREVPGKTGLIVDPMVLDKHLDPYRKGSRKLTDLCAHYGARLDGAHDASYDALAAARVAWRIGQRHPTIGAMPLEELQELQRDAYRAQAEGLNAYWIKKGDARRVDNCDWPVRAWREASRGAT